MKARIIFRSEIYINGANLSDIKEKFEKLDVFSGAAVVYCSAEFIEYTSIEDADTMEDITGEYINAPHELSTSYKLELIWGIVKDADKKIIEFKNPPVAPFNNSDGTKSYCTVKSLWIDEERGYTMVHDGCSDWAYEDDDYTHEGMDAIIKALRAEGYIKKHSEE